MRFLLSSEAKAKAWAQAQRILATQIPAFVATLTPVLLRDDIRVTNNGFDESTGRPTPRQSILERGTAVLVDRVGMPRVRCYCGNPLGPPEAVRQKLVGLPWLGLDTKKVRRIVAAPAPVTEFVVVDVVSGSLITQPVDTSAPEAPTTTSTSAVATTVTTAIQTTPTTTTTTTAAPANPVDLTSLGTVKASSTFGGGTYPPTLAVDGNPATSWFSAGPQNGFSTYTFTLASTRTIQRIGLLSNAANTNPQFRQNFGFGEVAVEVRNCGTVTFSGRVDLSGTPDPDVDLSTNVPGDEIIFVFTGSEDPGCGGFAELSVIGV